MGTLSGGEQQRAALLRAPSLPSLGVLLLDEPLGSLDRRLARPLLDDLGRIFDELGSTAIYVTHDQTEAFTLGDRVAVMRAGRVVQVATPDELWAHPHDADTARFLGLRERGRRRGDPPRSGDRPPSRGGGNGVVERVTANREHSSGSSCAPRRRRVGSRPLQRRSITRQRVIGSTSRSTRTASFACDHPPSRRRPRARAGSVLPRLGPAPSVDDRCRRLGAQHRRRGGSRSVSRVTPGAVEALVAFCREGPRGARVDRVDVIDEEPEGFSGFAIR